MTPRRSQPCTLRPVLAVLLLLLAAAGPPAATAHELEVGERPAFRLQRPFPSALFLLEEARVTHAGDPPPPRPRPQPQLDIVGGEARGRLEPLAETPGAQLSVHAEEPSRARLDGPHPGGEPIVELPRRGGAWRLCTHVRGGSAPPPRA